MMFKKFRRGLLWCIFVLFILMNIVAYSHAYKFTHFDPSASHKPAIQELSLLAKVRLAFFGLDMPRPTARRLPDTTFQTIHIESNKRLEAWYIPSAGAKGTVALFHGYGGEKSSMLDKAAEFRKMGYATLLVDFMGVGGSAGNQTTIGFKEALQVKSCYDFLKSKGEDRIVLFGTSLGAAAIMKAASETQMAPSALIIECPFGTMLQTTKARFRTMGIPSFPMAYLLLFWGGVQNGFNPFAHNPSTYSNNIHVPTLLFYGVKDQKVSRQETDEIYKALPSKKQLVVFPEAGHENYLRQYRAQWTAQVDLFLSTTAVFQKDSVGAQLLSPLHERAFRHK